jgi:light-independent protochlorophyllide reductase subunit B
MKLAYWMYAGPAHIGTLRVASSFQNVHAIMHAPLGDDYFHVMRSMLERERDFTPVTTSLVDRHVLARGSQDKVVENIVQKDKEENPDLLLLTPTCTSSILQEDLQNFADRAALESQTDILLADVNHYRVNELQAADRTLQQILRFYIEKTQKENPEYFQKQGKTAKPSANILGILSLGFHHQHDCRELKRLLFELGIETNLILPEGTSVSQLKDVSKAWFNIVPYREIGSMAAQYLEKEFQMPYVSMTPMGILETGSFIRQIEKLLNTHQNRFFNEPASVSTLVGEVNPVSAFGSPVEGLSTTQNLQTGTPSGSPPGKNYDFESYITRQAHFVSEAAWFSRSIDCQNLTGKKTVVFGDATHAAAMTKILAREMGIRVSCSGTYCKHDADWFREQVSPYCDSVLITDDHTEVGDVISRIEPAAIFGTQMERHIGKRLGIPCGVISAPIHIQNFPLGYRPFVGYEGTNQIADLVYNSFSLGMEDHLLDVFGGHDTKEVITKGLSTESECSWTPEALTELNRIPGFVRGKVKRNTEKYARSTNILSITVEVMYAAKEAVAA